MDLPGNQEPLNNTIDDNESMASFQLLLQDNKLEDESSLITNKDQRENSKAIDDWAGSSVDLTIRQIRTCKTNQ